MGPAREVAGKAADAVAVKPAGAAVKAAEARVRAGEALVREAPAKVAAVPVRVDAAHARAARVKAVGVAALACRPARRPTSREPSAIPRRERSPVRTGRPRFLQLHWRDGRPR